MPPRLPLALVFSSLLAACGDKPDDSAIDSECNHSCCGFVGGTFENQGQYTIDAATYAAALGEDETLSAEACARLCAEAHWLPEVVVEVRTCSDDGPDANGDQLLSCAWLEEEFCEGRAHAAVERATLGRGPDPVAAWLARAARAEASSACAFARLRVELLQHDAPDHLIARCEAAARDELAHARAVGGLARARGAGVQRVVEVPFPPRSLEALARENAVEGCVGETWSALQAVHQARAAADPALRVAMARIAEDETRHAELAHDLHAWLLGQLDPDAAARVEAARVEAWRRLVEALRDRPEAPEALGLPPGTLAARLAEALTARPAPSPAC